MYHDVILWLENHLLTCPIKALTGHDCPGCGMQRAILSLLKGDIAESIAYHPAAIPSIVLIIFLGLHLKFRFRFGAKLLIALYILTALITMGNFLLKTFGDYQ